MLIAQLRVIVRNAARTGGPLRLGAGVGPASHNNNGELMELRVYIAGIESNFFPSIQLEVERMKARILIVEARL